jgi:putative Mg2+ transporter-C (MgtC) family protein
LVKVLLTYALTLPIGRERAQDEQSAGLRTFPLVAVAACGYIVLASQVLGATSAMQAHILQGLITGSGFIGGGAIVHAGERVRGTATAASIWATSIIGAAIGYGRIEIAVMIGLVTFFTLRLFTRIEQQRQQRQASSPPER